MVSTPFSLTETWSVTNSLTVSQSSEALISNVSASDLRWARSPDASAPAFGPGDAHLLRPGRSQRVPLAAGQSLWLAGSAGGRAIVDLEDLAETMLRTRADLVARVAGGWIRPDGEPVWAGGHAYAWSAGATVIADLPGLVPLAPFHGAQFGLPTVLNDGASVTGDYSAQLQAAHDYIAGPLIGGGTLDLGPCRIGIGATLYFGELGPFRLIGDGRGTSENSKLGSRSSSATRLAWTGAAGAVMIEWTSDRADTGTADRGSGGGMEDIHLDGQEVAGIGLRVRSYSDQYLRIRTSYFTTCHFLADTLDNGLAGAAADTQSNRWNIRCDDVLTGTEPAAQVVINGSAGSATNTSITVIEELRLICEKAAVAAHFGSVDATLIEYLHATTRTAATGDGGKVIFHASDTLPAGFGTPVYNRTREIAVAFVEATRGIVAKAGIGAGAADAGNIYVQALSRGNGAPLPVQEAYDGQISFTSTLGRADVSSVKALLIDRLPVVGGGADAITLDSGAQLTAVESGTRVRFMAGAPNTGAATIQLDQANALPAKTVTGADLPADYIRVGVPTEAVFDGAVWIVDRQPEYGGTDSANYLRHADGTQTCRMVQVVTRSDADTLSGACTYPHAFESNGVVYPAGAVNTSDAQSNLASTPKEHLGAVQFGVITNTGCNVFVNRAPGGTSFVAGDQTSLRLTFSGRWY
ncbi:MAG: hypothetical protein ACWA5A_10830 [Marinibacterium sp.]